MREIPLDRGLVALVSDEDYGRVSAFRWRAMPRDDNSGGFYASRAKLADEDGPRTVYMHRFILQAPRGLQVDHANGDGLNNQRENLRLATQAQNNANRDWPPPRSGYRGVYTGSRGSKFRAQVGRHPNLYKGPHRATAAEAARDYDAEALRRFGEFARLNFPGETA